MSDIIQKENRASAASCYKGKILAVSGSSGGHIFPALGFLAALQERYKDIDTLLILPRKNMVGRIDDPQYHIRYISISPFAGQLGWKNIVRLLSFARACVQSLWIILQFRPHLVVGFGSVACIPVFLLAKLCGIKTCLHEQNVILGKANKWLSRFADRIAISFAESKDYLKLREGKIILTGNPLRQGLARVDKEEALKFFWPADTHVSGDNNFNILVMGGSQGSQRINTAFLQALSMVSEKSRLGVIHLTGQRDGELLSRKYVELSIRARLFAFLNSMHYAYGACDLAITRAGATTLSELIYFQVPAIIIPYPYAHRHQLANAAVLEKKGAAVVINDSELETDRLSQTIETLLKSPQQLQQMRSAYRHFSQADAAGSLVSAVMGLING